MARYATKPRGEKFAPAKIFAPDFPPSEREAAEEFSAVILEIDTGAMAQSTKRSKETVKCWKKGRAFPNGLSLMALISDYPRIRDWANAKTGNGFQSPQALSIQYEHLERIMASDTAEGRAMRARFQQLIAEKAGK